MSKKGITRRQFIIAAGGTIIAFGVGAALGYYFSRAGAPSPTQTPTVPVTTTPTSVTPTPTTPPPPVERGPLNILWALGYFAEEKLAVLETVRAFEDKTGVRVAIDFPPPDAVREKLMASTEARSPPDLAYSTYFDAGLGNVFASKGYLLPVDDIIEELRPNYLPGYADAAMWLGPDGKRRHYGVPWAAFPANYIHVWKPLIEDAGYKIEDIPQDWYEFYDFFIDVEKKLKAKGKNVSAFGISLGAQLDTPLLFEEWLMAYGGYPVKRDGTLNVDDPKVKDAFIKVLTTWRDWYDKGHIPKGSTTWKDPDNNAAFNARKIVMVFNPTGSIPIFWLLRNLEVYQKEIVTIKWPNRPDGKRPEHLMRFRAVTVFKDGKNPELAKEFIKFLMEPERQLQLVKGHKGRYMPVYVSAYEDKFFKEYHPGMYARYMKEDPMIPLSTGLNVAWAEAWVKNIHQNAIARVIVDRWDPEKAYEEWVSTAKEIAAKYE